jgi:DNA-binding NtrC family response regulator
MLMPAMTVLLVSADMERRAELAATLRAAGHTVAVAADGNGGVAALSEPGIEVLALDLASVAEIDGAALRTALTPNANVPPDSLEAAERRHIAHVLRHTRGNKRQAAILLGISRSTLLHKVRKYGIVTAKS